MTLYYKMYSLVKRNAVCSYKASTSTPKLKRNVVVCSKEFSVNEFIEKRKEVDKLRVERIKEIGNTLDHVVKSEVKQTVEIMTEVMPFLKQINGIEKFIGKTDSPSSKTTIAPTMPSKKE